MRLVVTVASYHAGGQEVHSWQHKFGSKLRIDPYAIDVMEWTREPEVIPQLYTV